MKKYLPNKYIGGALLAATALLIAAYQGRDETEVAGLTDVQPVVAANASTSESGNFLGDVARGRDFYPEALHDLTRGDPEGERLSSWHDVRVTYAAVLPGTSELFGLPVSTTVAQPGIAIVMVSPEELRELGVEFISPWQYNPDLRRMHVVPPGGFTPTWAGAILAHELTHAMEYDAGLLEPSHMADDAHQDGEIRAYNVEIRLLDRAVDGALLRFVDRMIDERELGENPDASPDRIQPTMDEVEAFSALFAPPASDEEYLTRIVVLQTAVNYRFADRFELGDSWKRRYNLFLEELIAARLNQPERLSR